MNSFSNMEINDLLDNRFRLEDKHTPNYLAECFQRLFPTLGRMGLSTVIDEMARANHRAFNSSKLPIRGETLDLRFFFNLWKRNFRAMDGAGAAHTRMCSVRRFEGSHSDKFTFGDELKLAFRVNPREFWEVLVRADRDLGNYLKDSIELLKYRDLPKEISLNLRLNGSSPDDKTTRLLREKLPFNRDNFTTHEIAKICLQLFEVANPADYDVRRLAEELEKENGIRRLSGSASAIHGYADTSASMPREPFAVLPKKALDRLSTRCVLEFFKSKPLASAEVSLMERGVYTVTEADLVLINSQGSEAFWLSIIPDKSIRERTLNMWKLAGMDSDARRFSAGKQILIATERALSDALHKHSAEMRDVYPLCGRAGISTREADKFMAMLYLCHDFYKGLANVYINTAMLARFGAPAARRLWDTIKSEGLKEGGIQKVNEMLSLKEFKMEEVEVPTNSLPPARKMEQTVKTGILPAAKDQNALSLGFYELSKEEQKYLSENNNDLLLIFERVQAAGHQILFALRERAGLKRSERNPASGHEEKLVFMPTQKAFEKAIKDNREGIELLRIISGRGDMDPKPAEDTAFLAMHLNYKGNWEFRAFSDEQMNLMREMRKHSAGLQHYSDNPWDRLRREKIFAQWPLKNYLPETEKLQKLTRAYWRAREKAGSTLGTAKLVLGVKPTEGMAVKYEGMTARRTTAGTIEAETQSFTNLTNELEEMRKKPAETNTINNIVHQKLGLQELIEDSGESHKKFGTLTGTAQSKLLDFLRETKSLLGNVYLPVLVNSGKRSPEYHAKNVIADKIDKRPNLYNYYKSKNLNSWETSKNVQFYNMIQNQYDGNPIDEMIAKWGISEEDEKTLKTIEKEDKTTLITASTMLMERNTKNGFEGTDHRDGTAVDLNTADKYVQTIKTLDSVIKGKVPLTYGGGKDLSNNDHMHITLIRKD